MTLMPGITPASEITLAGFAQSASHQMWSGIPAPSKKPGITARPLSSSLKA
jgi:hypothetical protein